MSLAQPDRNRAIQDMRHKQLFSLQQIADVYGITRERVRQILGNTGAGYVTRRHEDIVRKNPDKKRSELEQILGRGLTGKLAKVRTETRHAIEGGGILLGTEAEILVSEKMKSLKIKHELMPHGHVFDILLSNGKRIDVKSRINQSIPPSAIGHLKTPQWRFDLRVSKKGDYADFFILFIWETRDFFIIPLEAVAGDAVAFCWPRANKPSKWHEYHNRWDLLR